MNGPELLQIPEKLKPLLMRFNDYRYFLSEGGRGGGKSQAIGRLLLYVADQKKLRIVCGREIQNSIEESVYTVFVDLIRDHNLAWDTFRDRLVNKENGSEIKFKGFREQGRVSIKGLEGVDILWIDEAQGITPNTLEIIIPTIRKENAKVFFSMNRYLKNDAVFTEFAGREDCLHLNINYMENPYCPKALLHEAELCRLDSPEDYEHIWLGHPREEADDYLFTHKELDACRSVDLMDRGQSPDIIAGFDIARYGEDKCIGVILERMTATRFSLSHVERWGKKDLMETVGRIIDVRATYKPAITVVDGDGLGAGVCDRLRENGIDIVEFRGGQKALLEDKFLNKRAESYCSLKDLISRGLLRITHDSVLEQLGTIRFKFDSYGRRAMLRKEDLKAKGIESPDEADALMMAVSEVRNIGQAISVNKTGAHVQPAYSARQSVLRRMAHAPRR
jgi:phage terminase large subunit